MRPHKRVLVYEGQSQFGSELRFQLGIWLYNVVSVASASELRYDDSYESPKCIVILHRNGLCIDEVLEAARASLIKSIVIMSESARSSGLAAYADARLVPSKDLGFRLREYVDLFTARKRGPKPAVTAQNQKVAAA